MSDDAGRGADLERIDGAVTRFTRRHELGLMEQGLVLGEESGELQRAILAHRGDKLFKPTATTGEIAGEVGDVIFTAMTVAEVAGVDPIDATLATVEKNANRDANNADSGV